MISFSTRVAGVLLVFVFLVAPAILAFVLTNRIGLQLLIGWVTGTLVTVEGLYLSSQVDIPSGPAVIAFYGAALVVAGIALYLWRAESRLKAARTALFGIASASVAVLGIWGAGRWLGPSDLSTSEEARQVEAEVSRERTVELSRDNREHTARQATLSSRIARCVGQNKIVQYLALEGPEERLQHARKKLSEDRRRGLEFLLNFIGRRRVAPRLPRGGGGASDPD